MFYVFILPLVVNNYQYIIMAFSTKNTWQTQIEEHPQNMKTLARPIVRVVSKTRI